MVVDITPPTDREEEEEDDDDDDDDDDDAKDPIPRSSSIRENDSGASVAQAAMDGSIANL